MLYKHSTTSPQNIVDRCSLYDLTITQHYKEIKNHRKRVSNIKPFIDQLIGMVLITQQVKEKITEFETYNPKIALVGLFNDVDIKVFKDHDREYADTNKKR